MTRRRKPPDLVALVRSTCAASARWVPSVLLYPALCGCCRSWLRVFFDHEDYYCRRTVGCLSRVLPLGGPGALIGTSDLFSPRYSVRMDPEGAF